MLSQHECLAFYKMNTKARKKQKSTRYNSKTLAGYNQN
uniref:Uncharacterized protein n=1 Tax=Anguilla anguilla TaxID=7936 RepID=A0A0E9Y1C9_ANGAN